MKNRILERLNEAEAALRENLRRHELDTTARVHLERALSHVREASIAVNEIGKARSVRCLVNDLEKVERLTEKLMKEQHLRVKPLRV